MDESTSVHNTHSVLQTATRGFLGKCPQCNKGRLLKSYLKQVEICAVCGESFSDIRADDGPAWLTVLLVGHIIAPVLLAILPRVNWSEELILFSLIGMALVLSFFILPRAKGLFIALIWRSRKPISKE